MASNWIYVSQSSCHCRRSESSKGKTWRNWVDRRWRFNTVLLSDTNWYQIRNHVSNISLFREISWNEFLILILHLQKCWTWNEIHSKCTQRNICRIHRLCTQRSILWIRNAYPIRFIFRSSQWHNGKVRESLDLDSYLNYLKNLWIVRRIAETWLKHRNAFLKKITSCHK